MQSQTRHRTSLFAAALMTGACALVLTACDSMKSAWNDVTGDDTPYAGDVQAPPAAQTAQETPAASTQMTATAPAAQPVIPVAAQAIPPQPVASNYTPNLASVPARPTPAEMPSAQQVQTARADLMASNQMATGYLRDPNAPMQPAMMAPAPTPADLMAGQSLGLQQTSPGKYALTPLAPEVPLGGFHLASSLMFPYGNTAVTLPQYQELRRVATEYTQQPGRVRVVSYGDTTNSPDAITRATTAAAYLVDMGVPPAAIRVKLDAAAPTTTPVPGTTMSKTDIFLETPPAK